MSGPIPARVFSNAEILHISVEVMNGRGRHGEFLTSFAEAIVRADHVNMETLRASACTLIERYKLEQYLDTFEGGEATTA